MKIIKRRYNMKISVKRVFAISLVFCMILVSGCGANKVSLYDKGLESISMIKEMASNEEYIMALTGSPEIKVVAEKLASKDLSEPKAVYEITFDENVILSMLGIENTDSFSNDLKEDLIKRSYMAVSSQLNAMGGVAVLATSNMLTTSKSFNMKGFNGNRIYLYTFKDAYPIMVSFTSEGDDIVNLSSMPCLNETLTFNNIDEVTEVFSELGGSVSILLEVK